jgi:tetratricopeptide (TPR) repeat protein
VSSTDQSAYKSERLDRSTGLVLTAQGIRNTMDAALACFKACRFEEAVRIFGDLLSRLVEPQIAEAWWLYGQALAETGRLEAAADALTRAAKLDPDDGSIWRSLGGVYGMLDRPEPAREALRRAIELHQDDAGSWSNLGVIERKLGRPEVAIQCHRRAIAADPAFAPAWRNLGNALDEVGAVHDAVKCFERLVVLRPTNARDWSDLGIAYGRVKQHDQARQAFERALAIDSRDVDATYNLAIWHLMAGDPPRARAWYGWLKGLSPDAAREMAGLVARIGRLSVDQADALLSAR